jgi:hypothetical protein
MKQIGIVSIALALIVSRFSGFDVVAGLLLGIGGCCLLFSILPETARDKLKEAKKALFHRS